MPGFSGTEWRYIDTAQGKATLLALSGAACIAEMSWQSIEHFAQRYRMIAPDYPAIDTMTELVDGIAAILDQEGISQARLFSGSGHMTAALQQEEYFAAMDEFPGKVTI